jgi:hydroxymethylglutaryl-CoA reductase
MTRPSSRLPSFHALAPAERLQMVAGIAGLDAATVAHLGAPGNLPLEQADRMVENVISTMNIPLGIATNFLIDGREVLVPMATEEASVVAAASNGARLCRESGGIHTSTDGPLMMAQIQVVAVADPWSARARLLERRDEIAAACDAMDPKLVAVGGGFRDLAVRILDTAGGPMVVMHIVVDTRDAMGANAVNSMAEALAPRIAEWSGGRVSLRIVTNLADRRLARARAVWPAAAIGGSAVAAAIAAAYHFALADPYRAATHNKGVMNGVAPVVLATGNDTRAVEAGAHAFAAMGGPYKPLARYELTAAGDVAGRLEMPMAVGIVGGATRVHPTAQACLKIIGAATADQLARVAVATGLVQQFAALRALTTEGIQKGHMKLHAQTLAMQAGATGDEIAAVAKAMIARGEVRQDVAEAVLKTLRGG